MSNKIKGILACAAAMILTVYIGGLLGNGTISPIPALMLGGAAGIICGAAIAIIRQGSAPLAVGIGTMAVLWTVVSVVMIQAFGTSGLDLSRFIITTLAVIATGAIGGQSYKFATKPAPAKFIGD